MPRKDPRVDAYIDKAQPFAKPILRHVRKLVHQAVPGVQETIKWSFPHFEYKGMLCSIAAFKAHCAMGFWNQSVLEKDMKQRTAMGQFGRLLSTDDLPSDALSRAPCVRDRFIVESMVPENAESGPLPSGSGV